MAEGLFWSLTPDGDIKSRGKRDKNGVRAVHEDETNPKKKAQRAKKSGPSITVHSGPLPTVPATA